MRQMISTTQDLEKVARTLSTSETFFIDTEFEQKSGNTTLCLIQIGVGEEIFLIDAMRLTEMKPLAAAIGRPGVEWVMHSGSVDTQLLVDKLKLEDSPLVFDTQLAWGLLGAESSVSLAYLNYRLLGARTEKTHQADSWQVRPLSESQLSYAARDVETLPMLHKHLNGMLQAQGKQSLVHEVTREYFFASPFIEDADKVLSIADFRNAWELDYGGRAALEFLINWWNQLLQDEKPPGLKPHALFLIARRMPESGKDLAQIKGVPRAWAKQHGDLLTGRLIRASYEAKKQEYPAIPPPPYLTFDEIRVDAFLSAMRYAVSRAVRIAPDICFPLSLLQGGLRERLLENGDLRRGHLAFEGWRRKWLTEPYHKFCAVWSQTEHGWFDRQRSA